MAPLAPFRDQLLVLSNLNCVPMAGRPGGTHAKASTRFLTDVSPPTSESMLDAGISMDQILAQETGKHTQLASLELGIESSDMAGACDTGFACPYTNTISWRSANTPLPTQNNPRVVFEHLFGDSGSTDPKVRLARLRRQRSILDSMTEEVSELRGTLGPADRTKLVEYLEAIRDVERRIQKAEAQSDQELPTIDHPGGHSGQLRRAREVDVRLAGAGVSVRSHSRHHDDDRTRTERHDLSADRRARRASPDLASPGQRGENCEPGKDQRLSRQAVLVPAGEAPGTRPTATGSLLDHMTMMYGCGIADPNSHSPFDIPLVLAGGGAGNLKGGRHIRYPKDTPLANLHLTLLDQFGVHWDRIGDSTGKLDDHQLSLC